MSVRPDLDTLSRRMAEARQAHRKLFLFRGLVFVVLGLLVVLLPQTATFAEPRGPFVQGGRP